MHNRTVPFVFTRRNALHSLPNLQEQQMSVARVTEIISSSKKSFDEAVELGVKRACETLQNVKGAWVSDFKLNIKDGKIKEYRVVMKVTFVLNE